MFAENIFLRRVSMSREESSNIERQTLAEGVNLINFFSLFHTLNIFRHEHYQSVNNMQSGINWFKVGGRKEKFAGNLNKLAF